MHNLLAGFLLVLAGWTLSSHLTVLLGWNLYGLLAMSPIFICTFSLVYLYLARNAGAGNIVDDSQPTKADHGAARDVSSWILIIICLVPAILYFSWMAFWLVSLAVLAYCLATGTASENQDFPAPPTANRWEAAVIILLVLAAVALTLLASRADLDDAYYVASAAATAANPGQPIQTFDPMFGEPGLPLAFPTLRFLSYELLAGAVAYLTNLAAMNVIYIVLPPLGAAMAVICIFLLAREMLPSRWLLLGVVTFLLVIILGQTHRAPANMMFVRMFQGKALYYSIVLPAIFYLTARYFSARGSGADLFLLACCQAGAIGLSQFGMMGAPLAGATALAANLPKIDKLTDKKLLRFIATLFITLPYLVTIAVQSNWGAPLENFGTESAARVWRSVFGDYQQYLIAVLLLIGPVLARDAITRWRLGAPPLILFAICLNPWLSDLISTYITTPLIYWRLTWAFPVLVFSAASICLIVDRLILNRNKRALPALLSAIIMGLLFISLPHHTLSQENIGPVQGFALRKIPPREYAVAESAIKVNRNQQRLLAHDQIAGVISRFENHPKLVNVRKIYLDTMAPAFGPEEYRQRCALYELVSHKLESDRPDIRAALADLDVGTVVIHKSLENPVCVELLKSEGYRRVEMINAHAIWHKVATGNKSQ